MLPHLDSVVMAKREEAITLSWAEIHTAISARAKIKRDGGVKGVKQRVKQPCRDVAQ